MVEAAGATALFPDEPDYASLMRIRRGLQSLEQFVADAGRALGCTPAMYHLLVAVKSSRRGKGIDIGMVASALSVRHPSAQEMARKAEAAGFLATTEDPEDGRRVLVELTQAGEETLQALASAHIAELRRLRGAFTESLRALG